MPKGGKGYGNEATHGTYPFKADTLCILQSRSPMDSTLVSKTLSTSVSGKASYGGQETQLFLAEILYLYNAK